MARDIIHPDHPFTEQEHAAALVLLGRPAADALAATALLKHDLWEEPDQASDETGGWSSVGPRVIFTPEFPPVIQVVAHVLSDGEVLSTTARDAWLDAWQLRLTSDEAAARLDELARLDERLTRYRPVLHRLLTTGRL